jgi:hypothetical protein
LKVLKSAKIVILVFLILTAEGDILPVFFYVPSFLAELLSANVHRSLAYVPQKACPSSELSKARPSLRSAQRFRRLALRSLAELPNRRLALRSLFACLRALRRRARACIFFARVRALSVSAYARISSAFRRLVVGGKRGELLPPSFPLFSI